MEKISTKASIKGIKINVPRFVPRPKYEGVSIKQKRARKANIVCNHYDISFNQKATIRQWDAKFTPELPPDSRQLINEIFDFNRAEIRKTIGSYVRASNCLFTFSKPTEDAHVFEFKGHKDYGVTLAMLDRKLSFQQLFSTDVGRFEIFRVINFQIKQMMKANKYVAFGIDRKFYDKNSNQTLEVLNGDFALTVLKGFKATMDVYQGGVPKLLIDCCSRVIRDFSLWDEVLYFKNDCGQSKEWIFDQIILDKSFLTSYGNGRIYRIEEIDEKMTPLSKFPNPKFKTFKDYFLKQYNVKIKEDKQFMVVAYRKKKEIDASGKKREVIEKIHLVPELLKPTGLTDEMRNNRHAMRDLARYTQIPPETRDKKQNWLASQLNRTKEGNELGLRIDPNSNVIDDALIFRPPQITLKNKSIPKGSGVFRIKEPIYSRNAKIDNWGIICDDRDVKSAQDFAMAMLKASKSLGIKVSKPKVFGVSGGGGRGKRGGGRQPSLQAQVMNNIEDNFELDIFLLFFQKRTADRIYKRVKTECNSRLAKHTQFFTNWRPKDKRSLNNLSIASNIVMQMVVKLGQPLWKVQLPYNLNNNGRMTMVVGGDVFHMNSRDSVASIVSTLNKDFTEFYCTNSFQKRRGDDILHAVADQVADCAKKYGSVNGYPPDLIVFFRDGIGMGSFDKVREVEIQALLHKLESLKSKSGTRPKLAYIVVNKRINDRFFEKGFNRKTKREGLINPNGGLIVQSNVVNNEGFDYFMVAQNVNMGTATPVHFEVLYNDTGLTADSFYELTYYQTFNYYNWSGPVKVPSVVQYATKQAYLVGSTKLKDQKTGGSGEDRESMRKTLYFL